MEIWQLHQYEDVSLKQSCGFHFIFQTCVKEVNHFWCRKSEICPCLVHDQKVTKHDKMEKDYDIGL